MTDGVKNTTKPASRRPVNNSTITDNELQQQLQDLGWFGKIFGSRGQAAVMFAGVIGIMSTVGLIVVGTYAATGTEKADLLQHLSTIVIASFTFLGGLLGSENRK